MSFDNKNVHDDSPFVPQEQPPSTTGAGHRSLLPSDLLEHMRDGYALLEEIRDKNNHVVDFKFHEVNSMATKFLGTARERLRHHTCAEIMEREPTTQPLLKKLIPAIASSPEQQEQEKYFAESSQWISWTTYRRSKNRIYLLFRDTTERHRPRKEAAQKHYLESLGHLAGGIAHGFNNLFQGIVGHINVAQMFPNDPERVRTSLEKALEVAGRAQNLSNQLRTFSKGGSPNKKRCCLHNMIKGVLERASLEYPIEGVMEIPDDLWPCDVDETQVCQAIEQIIRNAAEAEPDKGQVRITAQNTHIPPDNSLNLQPGPYLRMTVADAGRGIPQTIQRQIFDPFFTTKSSRQGLGLTTAFSIVTQHGGSMFVDSEHMVGTTVRIYLPAIEDSISAQQPTEQILPLPKEGRILVMDDEDFICETLSLMLVSQGFTPTCVTSGKQAIDAYRQALIDDKRFDAVILDLSVSTGMGGREVIQCLRKLDPNVRAIVSSGYSCDKVMANPKLFGFRTVLPKPYGLKELRRALANTFPPAETKCPWDAKE